MEKTQARYSGPQDGGDGGARSLIQTALAPLTLAFLTPTQFAEELSTRASHLLGVAAFGRPHRFTQTLALTLSCPVLSVALPLIDGDTMYEVWSSDEVVHSVRAGDISATHTEHLLFGCFEPVQASGQSMEAVSYAAYTQLFEFLDRLGFAHLWRVWHYLPDIGGTEFGCERYHGFNLGRHEAFRAQGRTIGGDQVPAACALGTPGERLALYFIAGRSAGVAIENPRQTSAYDYPSQYGPRSPTFARAMLTQQDEEQQLFISGTASIVGHASQHAGDVQAQARETLTNVQTLLERARAAGLHYPAADARLALKVYLQDPGSLPGVRQQIHAALGKVDALYLQAEVCRKELLLEIEALCLSRRAT